MLRVIGLNYQSTPIDLREKVAVGKTDLSDTLQLIGTSVILSTCNRTEIYVLEGDQLAAEQARGFFVSRMGLTIGSDGLLYELEGDAAVRHLCEVAAGLESMVLGESQILGQVREALLASSAIGRAGPVLTRAFRTALRVGRRARHETFVGHHSVSVSRAAVELAKSTFGDLEGKRVLVVGAGEMGELTTQALVDSGGGVFAVLNRTVERAKALAERHGGIAASLADSVSLLRLADIVITSTDSPEPVITAGDVRAAMTERVDRPLFIIDIAVPRDVDPDVRNVDAVELCDIDDLKARCEHNRHRRGNEIQRVYAIVDQEIARLTEWSSSRSTLPTVVELRARAEQIRQVELVEAFGHLRHLSDDDRTIVDALTKAIVNKLLHRPTVELKQGSEATTPDRIRLARELFGLDDGVGDAEIAKEAGGAFPDR